MKSEKTIKIDEIQKSVSDMIKDIYGIEIEVMSLFNKPNIDDQGNRIDILKASLNATNALNDLWRSLNNVFIDDEV